jgi:hypothetical protein
MAFSTANLKAIIARHRLHSEVVGVSALAILAAFVVGTAARRQAAPLMAERDRLRAQEQEIASFRAAFQPASEAEWVSRIPDTLSLSIEPDSRIGLMQSIALRGENAGLHDVRVRLAGPDSAAPAPTDLPSGAQVAAYTLALDGVGGFGSLVSFVKQLPLSVALQRVSAVRGAGGTVQYHVVLAVYEKAGAQHG